ncbi:uncharacterized protein LOC144569479 isoform X2 [Carex rostrata]
MTDVKGEGKGRGRGGLMSSGGSGKKRPYALLLLLALGAAVLSVVILQKMRERRVFGILLQERDSQLLSLQLLLEKEKSANKDIRKKHDELKAKAGSLRTQRMELNNKLLESESATTYLKVMQQELESALVDKENYIKQIQERTSDDSSNRIAELTKQIQQKDGEIENLKRHLSDLNTPQKTEEQPKVTESSTTAETNTTESDQALPGDSKEENWVKFTTNLEDETNQNSDKQKEGRKNLEVKVDSEGMEKEEQVIQGNTLNENGNVDSTVASGGEGVTDEVQDQQAAGGSGARKLKMFTSYGI